MFPEDLLTQLRKLGYKGDRAIIMIDVKEDVIDRVTCKHFRNNDLNMGEVSYSQTNVRGSKTYFKGKVAFDGIWVTEELEVSTVACLPFNPELRDHQPVVVNISKKSLLCVNGPKIKSNTARHLNFKVKRICKKHMYTLDEEFRNYRVLDRLATLKEGTDKGLSKEAREAPERADLHIMKYMTSAEKAAV